MNCIAQSYADDTLLTYSILFYFMFFINISKRNQNAEIIPFSFLKYYLFENKI